MKIINTILFSLFICPLTTQANEISDVSRNYNPKFDRYSKNTLGTNVNKHTVTLVPSENEINQSSRNYDEKYDLFKQQELAQAKLAELNQKLINQKLAEENAIKELQAKQYLEMQKNLNQNPIQNQIAK